MDEVRDWFVDETPGGGMAYARNLISLGIGDRREVVEVAEAMLLALVDRVGLLHVLVDWPDIEGTEITVLGEGVALEAVEIISTRSFFCVREKTLCYGWGCIPTSADDLPGAGEIVSLSRERKVHHLMNRLAMGDGEKHLRAFMSLRLLREVLRRCIPLSEDFNVSFFTVLEAVLAGVKANMLFRLLERV